MIKRTYSWVRKLASWDGLSRLLSLAGAAGFLLVFIGTAFWTWLPRPQATWGIPVFSGAGTMVGFHLTSLSILISARQSPALQHVIGNHIGDELIKAILRSMWSWALVSLLALGCWFTADAAGGVREEYSESARWIWAAFAGSLVTALSWGARALLWVSTAFSRFRSDAR